MEVRFYENVEDSLLKFAVIVARSDGKWVFCRHKERSTYELPGGRREAGETILDTAKRELEEETGALDFDIRPVCVYSVTGKTRVNETGEETFGMLYSAQIRVFAHELHHEMEEILLSERLPDDWTYPLIQPLLLAEYERRMGRQGMDVCEEMADAAPHTPLSEMTLEQLWELFPIVLSAHQSCWADWYEEERQRLISILPDVAVKIHHIGSTAIAGIWAKPIVDILVEIPEGASMEAAEEALVKGGYLCMSRQENRASFNRGYTEKGFAKQVFHVHVRRAGDHAELYFRDYMNAHPALAKEYEQRKLSLWKKYEHDRDAYTEAKSAFVKEYTARAREEYGDRYGIFTGRTIARPVPAVFP